jgi:adenylate kinase family enzyme
MDLRDERNAVKEAVNQIEGIPIAMELFTSRSQSPEEVCTEEVSKCDLYVGIFGKRYGFVPVADNPRELSASVIEFEKARELEIPTLIFVQRDIDRDLELKKFLKRVSDYKKGIFRKTFGSIGELKYWVLASFVHHLSKKVSRAEERDQLEKLVMDESLYKRFVEETCEYVDFKGVYQLRRVVQLRLDDIYVPLKLKESTALQQQSLEISDKEMKASRGVELAYPLLIHGIKDRFAPFPIYIRQRKDSTSPLDSVQREMDLREILSANKKLVILGAPGSGKTTILRHLAGALVGEDYSGLVPILLPLREYGRYLKSETDLSILDYLTRYFRAHGLQLPQEFFKRHLSSGRCVVMLDGLDEILDERDRIEASSRIEEFAACFSEGNTIVVSSRISAYRNVQMSGFDHYKIQRLTQGQVSDFISKWFENVEGVKESYESRRFISLVISDTKLLSLSMNPLMLSLICLIGLQGIPIPRKRADLYDVCVKTLISSWEARKGFQGVLTEPQGFDALKSLAYLFLEERKVTATEYEILSFTKKFLKKANLSEDEIRDQARVLLKNMTERAGLLVEREPNVYGFVHLGLRDYLAALHLAGVDNIRDMFHSLLLPKLHNIDYERVICLCSRCITHQSVSRAQILLNEILNAETPYEEYTHLDLVLAARCLFSSGISYGETARRILEKIDFVLKNRSDDERTILLEAFREIDFELFASFLSTLIKELQADVAIDLIYTVAREGIVSEESEFSDIALELLDQEIISGSSFAKEAADALGTWAARGSKKALALATAIIEKGVGVAERCAAIVVPIARRDPDMLDKMLRIIDNKDSGLRKYMLLALYDIAPSRVIEKTISIIEDKNEDLRLKKIAKYVQKYSKTTEEEARSLANRAGVDFVKSLLERKDLAAITDKEAVGLILVGVPSEKELLKRLDQLHQIFEANHILAFRLLQLFNYVTPEYSTLNREIKDFAQRLSQEENSVNRRLLAYMLTEVETLEIGKDKSLLIELAEDGEEFTVARRAAITRLANISISERDYARLLKLSSDREISNNLFYTLSSHDFDKHVPVQVLAEEVKRGQTHLIEILSFFVQRSYK